jgi:hypothetical protein
MIEDYLIYPYNLRKLISQTESAVAMILKRSHLQLLELPTLSIAVKLLASVNLVVPVNQLAPILIPMTSKSLTLASLKVD